MGEAGIASSGSMLGQQCFHARKSISEILILLPTTATLCITSRVYSPVVVLPSSVPTRSLDGSESGRRAMEASLGRPCSQPHVCWR